MLASKIYKAYKTNTDPFPKNDIPTLLELSIQVVADNFALYPHLPGVRPDIKDQVCTCNKYEYNKVKNNFRLSLKHPRN